MRERFTRRRVLGGAIGLGLVSGLEYLSLSGRFDHVHLPPNVDKARFQSACARLERAGIAVVHIGHSTHLLSVDGVRLVTDPWFYDPAFGSVTHSVPPAIRPEDITPLDAILVSHDHPDHADQRAIGRMEKSARVLCATATIAAKARANGFSEVRVLAPWESQRVGEVLVTAVPAKHSVFEVAFVVTGKGASVYFGGDSQVQDELPAIAERFHPEVAILSVDGTRVRGGGLRGMTPEDAIRAARVLGSKLVVPSHADGHVSDPFVRGFVVSSTEARGAARFRDLARVELPGVRAEAPLPGDLIVL